VTDFPSLWSLNTKWSWRIPTEYNMHLCIPDNCC